MNMENLISSMKSADNFSELSREEQLEAKRVLSLVGAWIQKGGDPGKGRLDHATLEAAQVLAKAINNTYNDLQGEKNVCCD